MSWRTADKQYKRSKELVVRGAVSEQERDIDLSRMEVARSALLGAQAQAVRTQSAIDAATAVAERLKAEIKDSVLRAPVRGRIQERMAEPGEVLAGGGKVLTLVDLSNVYMYVFLPENDRREGSFGLGSQNRSRCRSRISDHGGRVVRFPDCAIHSQDSRDGGGTPQSDFPSKAAA